MSAPVSRRRALAGAALLPAAPALAQAARDPAARCPAARLGRDLAAAVEAYNRADAAALAAPAEHRDAAARHFEGLWIPIGELRDALSRAQARSHEGVMAQAMVVSWLVDSWGGDLHPEVEQAIHRLLLSVVRFCEAAGGVAREEMAGEFMMARRLDPLRWCGSC